MKNIFEGAVLRRRITAVNIESTSARFITVDGKRVSRWGDAPLPPGLVKDTLVSNAPALGHHLHDFFAAAGVPRNNIVAGLPGLRSVSRIVALPRLRRSRINEAVRWEARREMRMRLGDLHLSWQIIDEQGPECRVFLLATPTSLQDTLTQALKEADVRPNAMYLKPLALARMVNRPRAVIMDLESDTNSIIVVDAGIPQIMHTMVIRQESFHMEDRIGRMTEDLERTLRFFAGAHPDSTLESSAPFYLTGGLSCSPEVPELMQKLLRRQVEVPRSILEHAPDFPVAKFAANLGLALTACSPRRQRISACRARAN